MNKNAKKKNSFFDLFKPQAPVAPAELPMLNTSAKVNPEDLIPKTEPLVLEKKEIISKNKEVDMDVSNWEDLDKYKSSHKDWPYYDTPPSSIYRKKYNQENTHLPEAVFLKDYKKQLLYCIATNDIPGMRALIEKLRIIMNAESKTDALYAVNTVSGDSLLMFAVKQQKLDAVRFLLAEGSDPHQPNNEGITPLDIAIKDRRTDIINAITEYGSYESKPITESESDLALWAKRRKQLKGIDDGESYESSYIYTEESSSENNSTSSSSSSDEFYGGPCKPKK